MEIGSFYGHAIDGYAVTIIQLNSLQVKLKRDDTGEEFFESIDVFSNTYESLY